MELQEAGNKEEAKEFVIWKELAEGKEMVCCWSLCDVYLVNDSLYPGWLVLVPRVCGAREIFQLSTEQQVGSPTLSLIPNSNGMLINPKP
jgi:hypothetical protein